MKYTCKCGQFSSDEPQAFFNHVAEGRILDGAQAHGRAVESQTQAKPETQAQPKAKTQKQHKPKLERGIHGGLNISRRWMVFGLCAALILIGILSFASLLGSRKANPLLGGLAIFTLGGGVIGTLWTWRNGDRLEGASKRHIVMRPNEPENIPTELATLPAERTYAVTAKGRGVKFQAPEPTGAVNSINVYARKGVSGEKPIVAVAVRWEYVATPFGQPWKLKNDGNAYYFHIIDIETMILRAFELTDSAYVDPTIFARFLENPAQKRYIEFGRESWQKWIGAGLLAAMNAAGLLVLIIMANPGGAT
jgi:hypothetical protein